MQESSLGKKLHRFQRCCGEQDYLQRLRGFRITFLIAKIRFPEVKISRLNAKDAVV
jgi:hypothetical protein